MHSVLAQLVRDRVACCNDGDWDGVRALTGAGYAYCEDGTGGRIDDVDEVLTALQRLRAAAPDSRIEVERVLDQEDVTVSELVWSATLVQRRLRLTDRAWARWVNGKVIAEWHEVGVLGLVAPLVRGVAPAAPGRR